MSLFIISMYFSLYSSLLIFFCSCFSIYWLFNIYTMSRMKIEPEDPYALKQCTLRIFDRLNGVTFPKKLLLIEIANDLGLITFLLGNYDEQEEINS